MHLTCEHAVVNHRIQALSFSKEIFGDGSIEMVPPYLLLSEANLGLGLLQSAEEFLSMANWSILKTPDCSSAIRSQARTSNEGEPEGRPLGHQYTGANSGSAGGETPCLICPVHKLG